mgnify:CR=1 FL=1
MDENVVRTVELQEVSEEQKPSGILADYSVKYAEKQAKKEKRQGVMQFIKYALCAASAGIIQLVVFTILHNVIPDDGKTINFIQPTAINTFVATTVALCASILWNFTLNRKFTFKDASNVPKAMILAFLFYVPFYPFQTWYVCTIEPLLSAKINATLAGIIAEGTVMVINFALEFMWQKFVVFRKPKAKKTEEKVEDKATDNQIEQLEKDLQVAQLENKIEEEKGNKTVVCKYCGAKNKAKDEVCHKCGAKLAE